MKKSLFSEMIVSICILIVGIFLLLYAETMMNIVTIVLGISMLVYGIFNIVKYFMNDEKNAFILLLGVVTMVLGIVLVLRPGLISEIISFIVGFYILLVSIPYLVTAIKYKEEVSKGAIVLPIIGLVVGILCIVGKFIIPNIILQFMGAMLIIYSIINVINVILLGKKIK